MCLARRPIVWLWLDVTTQVLHYPWCKDKSCWPSVNAHFYNILALFQQPFSVERHRIVQLWGNVIVLPAGCLKTQWQKSLMLHWRSFSGCGNKWVSDFFRYYAVQYIHFGRRWQHSLLVEKYTKLKILDALLTLTLITSKQPLYNEYWHATNHIYNTDFHYCAFM